MEGDANEGSVPLIGREGTTPLGLFLSGIFGDASEGTLPLACISCDAIFDSVRGVIFPKYIVCVGDGEDVDLGLLGSCLPPGAARLAAEGRKTGWFPK